MFSLAIWVFFNLTSQLSQARITFIQFNLKLKLGKEFGQEISGLTHWVEFNDIIKEFLLTWI